MITRSLRRKSAAARLLRVRKPPGAWKFVCCECCVLSGRALRRADHSSRGVLPTVVRHCVWSRNLVNEETLAHRGAVAQKKTLTIDQDTIAVTISSQLCSFPSVSPLRSLTFQCLFWLGSPFLKTAGSLQANPFKISFSTRNICIPLPITTTRKII